MSTPPAEKLSFLGGLKRPKNRVMSQNQAWRCEGAKPGQGRDLENSSKDSLDPTGTIQYCEAPKGLQPSCLLISVIPNGYTKRPKWAPFSSPPCHIASGVCQNSKFLRSVVLKNHDMMCLHQAFLGNFKITVVWVQGWRVLMKTLSNGVLRELAWLVQIAVFKMP